LIGLQGQSESLEVLAQVLQVEKSLFEPQMGAKPSNHEIG
jgi:hypothetical protein